MSEDGAGVVPASSASELLTVDDLEVVYYTDAGTLPALSDVSFAVGRGQIVGVVGESGCGKSTLGAALLRLLPPNGELVGGRVMFEGRDLAGLSARELRDVRGRGIATIFQDPLTSLNPTFTIGQQMLDAQRAHGAGHESRKALREMAVEALTRVGIPDAARRIDNHPHEFSGGMRQRIMIAIALLHEPALLIADEATSALDVTLEAQILKLLMEINETHGTAILLISHNLGVIAEVCQRVVVMYAGRAVEEGDIYSIFDRPLHPYTRALLAAVPSPQHRGTTLAAIPGRVPSLLALPPGCKFADRCAHAVAVCREREPSTIEAGTARVRCFLYDDGLPEAERPSDDRASAAAVAQ
jgi:oligopeptide/dipeptide ABC transporter ATP-binding protein